jgi:hypothetical protein
MALEINKSCELTIKFNDALVDFNYEQQQAIKDIRLILDSAGLKIYGVIAK